MRQGPAQGQVVPSAEEGDSEADLLAGLCQGGCVNPRRSFEELDPAEERWQEVGVEVAQDVVVRLSKGREKWQNGRIGGSGVEHEDHRPDIEGIADLRLNWGKARIQTKKLK